ncbi:hypothetical protein EUGRSUZ_C01439 [Eucalyptus grandis]|uniref:Uncharacterized protein n=2 Tax=Eucalyptus grandis TaxID=71139 RepID=A0ACC3LDD2_EUCGR|nr:hypothetical protein EUGRSUZ_C01439 [Eucalyptus grandis]
MQKIMTEGTYSIHQLIGKDIHSMRWARYNSSKPSPWAMAHPPLLSPTCISRTHKCPEARPCLARSLFISP